MTDAGIKGLCVSVDYLGMQDERVGQCKSIQTLNIRHTKVTEKGIQIAFENLPRLKELFSCFPIQILADLSVRFPQYSLTQLKILGHDNLCQTFPPYKIGSLGLAASMCSLVTKVTIEFQKGITNMELLGLLKLKNLCELSINGECATEEEISFAGGVAPLLKAFGKSLTLLKLKNLKTEADIGIIFENCPALSTLILDHVNIQQSEFLTSKKILSKLKFLTVSCGPEYDDFPSYYLISLLSSPELCEINIKFADTLTDQVLLDAAKRNQFCNLENLELTVCDNVTKRGINALLTDTNYLKRINVNDCKCLTKEVKKSLGNIDRGKKLAVRCRFLLRLLLTC